jgi:hypothetical protein
MAPISVVTVAHATSLTSAPPQPPPATPLSISSSAPTPTATAAASAYVRNMERLNVVEPAPAAPVAARSAAATTRAAPRLIQQAALVAAGSAGLTAFRLWRVSVNLAASTPQCSSTALTYIHGRPPSCAWHRILSRSSLVMRVWRGCVMHGRMVTSSPLSPQSKLDEIVGNSIQRSGANW